MQFLLGILVGMWIWDNWCARDHWYRDDIDEVVKEEDERNRKSR